MVRDIPVKLRRYREHNYVKKLHRLIALGALPVGVGLHQLDVCHDDWCRIYKGKLCNCDPDLRCARSGRHGLRGNAWLRVRPTSASPARRKGCLGGEC